MTEISTVKEVAQRYIADLPASTDCAFNVAKKGEHRFCSRMGRKEIGGYYFCHRHAEIVAQSVLENIQGDSQEGWVSNGWDD